MQVGVEFDNIFMKYFTIATIFVIIERDLQCWACKGIPIILCGDEAKGNDFFMVRSIHENGEITGGKLYSYGKEKAVR